jgi:L-ribulokinase
VICSNNSIVTTGGLPNKNKLLMQIYADVTVRSLYIASNVQGGAVGSAMYGAVATGKAAGGFDSIVEATRADGQPARRVIPAQPGQ